MVGLRLEEPVMATVDVSDLEDLYDELRSLRDCMRSLHGRLIDVDGRVGDVENLLGGAGAMLLAGIGGCLPPTASPAGDELAVRREQSAL
jgi:hypothetical protein